MILFECGYRCDSGQIKDIAIVVKDGRLNHDDAMAMVNSFMVMKYGNGVVYDFRNYGEMFFV